MPRRRQTNTNRGLLKNTLLKHTDQILVYNHILLLHADIYIYMINMIRTCVAVRTLIIFRQGSSLLMFPVTEKPWLKEHYTFTIFIFSMILLIIKDKQTNHLLVLFVNGN